MAKKILTNKEDSRVYLKRIEFEDALNFKDWTNFSNPCMKGYNYGNLTCSEIKFWFNSITSPKKRYFAIIRKEDGRFIGFLGLKHYNKLLKTAQLGIVLDADNVSKGYGYEAMQILLDYFFENLKFKELYLDVNDFNYRAYKLYKKLGFVEEGYKLEVFENQNINPDKKYFEVHKGVIYSKITQMKIRKDNR